MAHVLKIILGVFMLAGAAISIYGLYQVLQTMDFVRGSAERAKGTFVGYRREEVETTSSSPSIYGGQEYERSHSVMSFPCFEYR